MEISDKVRRSPAYAQYYYAQQKEKMERDGAASDAQELAKWAKTSGYLGQEAQMGLPSDDPTLQTQMGTGVHAEDFNPQRREMMVRNQALLSSGLPSLQEQALSQMGTMQTSRNTGINALNMEKWKKENVAAKQPNSYMEYQLAQGEGFPGSFMDYKQAIKSGTNVNVDFGQGGMAGILTTDQKVALGVDPDSAYVWGADGTPKSVKPTNFTDVQLQSAGYGERMDYSEDIFEELSSEDFDATTLMQVIGDNLGAVGGYAMTEQQQAYQQAMHDWVRAKLRKESGAVIADEEMAKEIRTYFPQPGESGPVIRQKAAARRRATKALARQSGGAYSVKDRNQQAAGGGTNYSEMTDEQLQQLTIERGL